VRELYITAMPIATGANITAMPIATGATGPELPTTPMVRATSGVVGQDFADCLSPGATPKVDIPPFAANNPSLPQWCPNNEAMPQMVYAPSADMYGCPPGTLMVVPMMDLNGQFVPGTYMMGENGQIAQFPCPMDQSQPSSWAPTGNRFHMPILSESDGSPEESDSVAPCKNAHVIVDDGADEAVADIAISDCTSLPDDVVALGNPRQMLGNTVLASTVEDLLETSSQAKREAIITWMQPSVLDLALSANGTRVIQKALEMSGGEAQIKMSYCFHGRVRQLLDSHHGNHVLQKSIVMMPPHAIQFILHELSWFRGGWAGVACHRFGCRVVERLLEHCGAELTAPIVAAVVAEIDSLSRHPFANYVVQHILEYTPAHRAQVVHALIQVGVPMLAQHRVSSNVVEKGFEHSDTENQQALAEAILSTPQAIIEMACSRYGTFTVRRMLDALQGTLRYMALQQLGEAVPRLRASKYGRPIATRVVDAFSKLEGTYC